MIRRSAAFFRLAKQRRTIDDLKSLVQEAQDAALKDNAAGRCFGLHSWTRWKPMNGAEYLWQTRECQRCGLIKDKRR